MRLKTKFQPNGKTTAHSFLLFSHFRPILACFLASLACAHDRSSMNPPRVLVPAPVSLHTKFERSRPMRSKVISLLKWLFDFGVFS